jgi:N-methylhydantoinase B
MDGNAVGAGARLEGDGIDLTGSNYGGPGLVYPDVEIVEQTSPVLVLYKRRRRDAGGAGRGRGGASVDEAFVPYGVGRLDGTLFGMRRYLPVGGLFGGLPGGCTTFERIGGDIVERLRRGDDVSSREALGVGELLPNNAAGMSLARGEVFAFGCAAGGGLGDPLERDAGRVALDVRRGYVSKEAAEKVYGVVVDGRTVDPEATDERRRAIRAARLARSRPPLEVVPTDVSRAVEGGRLGLDVVVVDSGGRRFAACAGCRRVLAEAPASWKRGAAVAETPLDAARGWFAAPVVARRNPAVVLREVFCTSCARLLDAEPVLEGTPLDDDVRPDFYRLARSVE